MGYILVAVAFLMGVYLLRSYQKFAKNLAEAKKSGIDYAIIPWYHFNVIWLLTGRFFIPFLDRLPQSWTGSWLPYLRPEWMFKRKYEVFENLSSDLLLLVTPARNFLIVSDADAVAQIVTRRTDFPKPVYMYKSLEIFGKNLVSTEGSHWRQHRKISAPSFGEKNNALVFKESVYQVKAMMKSWLGEHDNGVVEDVAVGTMRLALHVISRAGFGVRVLWPHEESGAETGFASSKPQGNHKLSYKDALAGLLEHLVWTVILPKWFAERSPWESHRLAHQCKDEWGQYMRELYEAKLGEVRSGQNETDGMDLMGSLVRGSGIADADPKTGKGSLLSEDEVLSNSFIFILAGHETTSNSISHSMLLLAMNIGAQRALQADVDSIVGDRDPDTWTYEDDFLNIFGGMPAAVMNETMRIIPPVVGIPKSTAPDAPQSLSIGDKRVVVPQDCSMVLNTAGLHFNPKYWPPVSDPKTRATAYDADQFKPERWILDGSQVGSQQADEGDGEDEYLKDGGPAGPDTSANLFKPQKGAYIPFSEGFRACIGRRFAQTETLVVLTYIFRYYSVELAVDQWADASMVERMNTAERREVWQKAHDRAAGLLKTHMESRITLQMRGATVPLRLVKRGQEWFA